MAKAIELPNECFLKRNVRTQSPPVPINKSPKPILEVIPINGLIRGTNDGAARPVCRYCPALLGLRFVEQATPDACVEIASETLVEVLSERRPLTEKIHKHLLTI